MEYIYIYTFSVKTYDSTSKKREIYYFLAMFQVPGPQKGLMRPKMAKIIPPPPMNAGYIHPKASPYLGISGYF